MRQIKFRARNPQENCWMVWEFPKDEGDADIDELANQIFFRTANLKTLGQYTGLHDGTKWERLSKQEQKDWLKQGKTKEQWNGKEIYEGDITCRHWDDGSWQNGEIIFDHDSAQFCWQEISPKIRFIHPIGINTGNSEVIGNIYEDPELLK